MPHAACGVLTEATSMRKLTRALAFISVLSLSCHEVLSPTAPVRPSELQDYAVFDAVLDGLFQDDGKKALPRYVLGDSTQVGTSAYEPSGEAYLRSQFGPSLAPILDATIADYTIRSKARVPLDASAFRARGRIDLLNRTIADSFRTVPPSPRSYWSAFYARYPGSKGYISFSLPGYDASRTHALLSYGHGCGGLCGDWGFVLLERRGNTWVILRRVVTGVS